MLIALTAETASWHPYCHATVMQFVAVPSSATLPSFPDDGAVARDWPVFGVGSRLFMDPKPDMPNDARSQLRHSFSLCSP